MIEYTAAIQTIIECIHYIFLKNTQVNQKEYCRYEQ